MTGSASAGAGASPSTADYDAMLDRLDTAIAEAERKIDSGRVRSPENEKVRVQYIRALAYCINVRRQVANDATLRDLQERVEKLEAAT